MKKPIYICLIFLLSVFGYPLGYYVLTPNADLSAIVSSEHHENVSGIGAYVINLDRSKERYVYVKDGLDGLGLNVERISAIDGKNLTQKEIDDVLDIKSYRRFLGHKPRFGTIGCYLSNVKVWQNFLLSDYEYAVVFQDDVSFDVQKLRSTINDLVRSNSLWDIVTFELLHNGSPLTVKTYQNGQKLSVYLMEVTNAGAYMLNRKAAYSLIEKAFPMKMPVDHYFTRPWEFDLVFAGIESPRLVKQSHGSSIINAESPALNKKRSLFATIQRSVFKLQSYIIRFVYNLKVYVKLKLAMRK